MHSADLRMITLTTATRFQASLRSSGDFLHAWPTRRATFGGRFVALPRCKNGSSCVKGIKEGVVCKQLSLEENPG